MNDIVAIIQKDILCSEISLSTILLKAKVLAHHLKNDNFKKWVKHELNGYPDCDELPDYRIVKTLLTGYISNGYHSYRNVPIPLHNMPDYFQENANKINFNQGIQTVEELSSTEDSISFDWPAEQIALWNHYNKDLTSYQCLEVKRPVAQSTFSQILLTVRSRLQDFVLEISNLSWDMSNDPLPSEQIAKIFQVTIYNLGELNMSDFQQKNGDTYHVGQAGAVGKYASSDRNTFVQSEQKQTLAESAEEIQKLLRQLEKAHPSATQSEMINYVNDETTASLKRRTSAALQAGGEAAIDEFILENKFLKVVKAVLKGWLEVGS